MGYTEGASPKIVLHNRAYPGNVELESTANPSTTESFRTRNNNNYISLSVAGDDFSTGGWCPKKDFHFFNFILFFAPFCRICR